jgi:alkaline phosphatase D
MNIPRLCLLLAAAFTCGLSDLAAQEPALAAQEPPFERIGFGSCAKEDKPQPIWQGVLEARPQLFLMLGDNVYADTEDMKVMRAKYARLAAQPGFKKLRATCIIQGVWDDHDYGANDAGADYPKKRESQEVFLDFFGVPKDSPRRTREGVYHAQTFGPAGRRVQVILLDARYFRSPLKKGYERGEPGEGLRGEYLPTDDPAATLLGEAQWRWLEERLREPAEVRIIACGIQFIPEEHGWEKWANFPAERKRFFSLLRETKAHGVLLLSGDRHMAEISRLAPGSGGPDYPVYEITSSSLNAPIGHRTKSGTAFVNEINSHRVGLAYLDANFGMIEIDWAAPDPVLRLQVRDEKGGVVLQRRIPLSKLGS